jgi:hypothetical protein
MTGPSSETHTHTRKHPQNTHVHVRPHPTQVCTCQACRALQGDAAADYEFTTIVAAAASSGAAAALFAPMAAVGGVGGRRLMAASNDEVWDSVACLLDSSQCLVCTRKTCDWTSNRPQPTPTDSTPPPKVIAQLAAVSSKVDTLRSAQDAVSSQVDALRSKVDQANLLAEARAANTRVQDLITGEVLGLSCFPSDLECQTTPHRITLFDPTSNRSTPPSPAGRADIAAGQRLLSSKLDALLQRQQAALGAALAASSTLTAIRGLGERQVAALGGLDAAVKEQVRTISVATQQGLISLSTVGGFAGLIHLLGAACIFLSINTVPTPSTTPENQLDPI